MSDLTLGSCSARRGRVAACARPARDARTSARPGARPGGRACRGRRRAPRPRRGPRRAAASRAGGTRGRRRPDPGRSASASSGSAPSPMPTGVALTTSVGRRPRRRAVGPGDRRAAPTSAAAADRGVGPPGRDRDGDAGPASASATTHRPRRATRAEHQGPRPGGVDARVAQRPEEAGAVGGVAVQRAVGLHGDRVDTAQARPASSVSTSHAAAAAVLCGIVTERPTRPKRARASSAAAVRPSGTSNARYTQSRPSSRYAALCSSGDSECRPDRR